MIRQWTIPSFALVLALSWLACPHPSRAEEEKPPEQGQEEEAKDDSESAGEGRRAARTADAWWNNSALIEALTLTDEQRSKMDGLLHGYLKRRRAPSDRNKLRDPFLSALNAGDLKEAQKQLDLLVEQSGTPVREHGELKIQVLSLLSDEQRTQLAKENSAVIASSWGPDGRQRGRRAQGPFQGRRRR